MNPRAFPLEVIDDGSAVVALSTAIPMLLVGENRDSVVNMANRAVEMIRVHLGDELFERYLEKRGVL